MIYNSFVYDLPHNEETDVVKRMCVKTPLPCPIKGSVEYYKWRFLNFMERHLDCSNHMPPKYYYGPLKPLEDIKKEEFKSWEATKIDPSPMVAPPSAPPIQIPLFIKYAQESWLGLDEKMKEIQKTVPVYKRSEKEVVPVVSQSYGYKYCYAFDKLLYSRLTAQGQVWEKKALLKLQEYMESGVVKKDWLSTKNKSFNDKYQLNDEKELDLFYNNVELKDSKFTEFAFATHPDAYLDAGLSKLPISDLLKIVVTPDIQEWGDLETVKQAWLVLKDVAPAKLEEYKNDVINYIKDAYESGSEMYEEAMDGIKNIFRK